MKGVYCYLDDIIITSKNYMEQKDILFKVLKYLKQHGLTVKREQFSFFFFCY